jgi:hypothetical protein
MEAGGQFDTPTVLPTEITRVLFELEARLASDPVWTLQRREISLSHSGIRTPGRPTRSLDVTPHYKF